MSYENIKHESFKGHKNFLLKPITLNSEHCGQGKTLLLIFDEYLYL